MKQLTILLDNKKIIMLAEKPYNMYSLNEMLMWYNAELLGEYNPRTGEIYFTHANWALLVDAETFYPVTYTIAQDGTKTIGDTSLKGKDMTENQIKEYFLSLLKSETNKAFPLKENPITIVTEIYGKDWQESESKVMPLRMVMLLIR